MPTLKLRLARALVCSTTQLTNSTTGSNSEPSINAAGTRIAFTSITDLTGFNAEIFLVDTTTGSLTPLTPSTSGDSRNASINADGTRIAFESTANLTGDNADGTQELFLADTTTRTLTQLTNSTGGFSLFSSINVDGTRIAFESTANLTGDNADGTQEIFLADTTTGTLTQLTNSTSSASFVGSKGTSINAAGTRIAFLSSADLTGGNADGNAQIFLIDTTTGSLTQLTPSSGVSFSPSINAAGTRIAFLSSADLTGGNADGTQELFLVDTTTGLFTQLTNTTDVVFNGSPSINAAGTRIAFESTANLTGGNADGLTEVFLATCLEIVNDLVTFTPLPSTFQTTTDTSGCPAGFAGKFSFAARLTAKSSSPALTDLQAQVQTLTNGNLLQNADGGPGGAGATLTVPQADAFADGLLSPAEAVDVPFVVCLQERTPFHFFVDVLGRVNDDGE